MGTDLQNAAPAIGATHRWRRVVFVIIEAPPRCLICARDMRAGRESTPRGKAVSTRTDDDAGPATDDVASGSACDRRDATGRAGRWAERTTSCSIDGARRP